MEEKTGYEGRRSEMYQEEYKLERVSIRLVRDAPLYSKHKIKTPMDALDVVGGMLCEMDREVVCVINLKSDGTPINCHFASMGALNYTATSPRELLKAGILSNAANMLLVHNHPSFDLHPSMADIALTDRMIKAAGLIGIPLLDHIIVGGDNRRFFSFKEKGMIRNPAENYAGSLSEIGFEPSGKKSGEMEEDAITFPARKGRSR